MDVTPTAQAHGGGGWAPQQPPPGGPPGWGGGGQPPGGAGQPPGAPGGNKPITGSPQTMAMHAMSIDPTTGLPHGEKPPASTAAIVSLISGVLLCLGPLTGVAAVVAGLMARKAARENPATTGGGTMAIVGILLGVLNLLGWMGFAVLAVLPALF